MCKNAQLFQKKYFKYLFQGIWGLFITLIILPISEKSHYSVGFI